MTRTASRWRPSRRGVLVASVVVLVAGVVWWGSRPQHAVTATGRTLCDVLSVADLTVLLGATPGPAVERVASAARPASCIWTPAASPAAAQVELEAMSTVDFRTQLQEVAGLQSQLPVGGDDGGALHDILARVPTSADDSCALFEALAEQTTGTKGATHFDNAGQVPAQYGGGDVVSAIGCDRGEVVSLAVTGPALDTSDTARLTLVDRLQSAEERVHEPVT